MTHDHCALLTQLDALKSADPGSVFAELIRAGLQALIDAEASAALGAGRYERSEHRTTYRNGTRSKTVATTSGDIDVQIPKLRCGSLFPSLLERRRRIVHTASGFPISANLVRALACVRSGRPGTTAMVMRAIRAKGCTDSRAEHAEILINKRFRENEYR
jgi:Transposase, Mutator family